jgi:uncharacterized repeat protein (TIGR01451 family)
VKPKCCTRKSNFRIVKVSTVAVLAIIFATLAGAQNTAIRDIQPFLTLSSTTWTPLGPAPISNGQRPGNGPTSGRINGIAAHPTDPNTLYVAAAGGGVWKTTNGGSTWSPLTDSEITLSMGAIAIAPSNPSVIYAGTGDANFHIDSNYGRGVLVSTNGGTSWTLRNNASAFDRKAISEIAVDPTNANVAYVAVGGNGGVNGTPGNTGIWKTTDAGVNWTHSTIDLTSAQPWTSVRIDPNNPSILYAAVGQYTGSTPNGVYKSTDAGTSWNLLATAPSGGATGRIVVAIAKSNSQVVYVSVASPGSYGLYKFMRSDNGGATFTDLTAGTPNYMGSGGWFATTLIVDPLNSAIVYAGGGAGTNSILRSINSGVTWTDINTGPSGGPHGNHHAAAFDASGRLLDGTDGGIYRLDNPSTVAWTQLNGNLNTIQLESIALHPTDPNTALVGSQGNGTARYTGTLGWTLVEGGDGGLVKFSKTNPLRAYHELPGTFSDFFRRSDDGGVTWTTKVAGINEPVGTYYSPFAVDPSNGDRVVFGGSHRLWQTFNGGDSWTPAGTSSFQNPITAIGLSPSNPGAMYIYTPPGLLFTDNAGGSWFVRNLPTNSPVSDIQFDPANYLIAYAVVGSFAASRVWRTVNAGMSWTDITGNLPALPVWSFQIDPSLPGTFYVGTDDGVYRTTDLGTTWARFGLSLPHAQVFQLELNSTLHILAAATHGRGAWEIVLKQQLAIAKQHSGNFSQGQTGAFYEITVTNVGAASTTGTITVTETPPTGLTVTAISGPGWNCTFATLSCQRSDPLWPPQTWPAIVVTVNVATNAPPTVINSATVSGGGDPNSHMASDQTTITPPVPDLTITKTHVGDFIQGQTGATYTITVKNVGLGSTNGTVSVTDTLPPNLMMVSMAGTGWSCSPPASCQRADALPVGMSYPPITLTVNVSNPAPPNLTNTATVSGGGDATSGNNTANDFTAIVSPLGFVAVTPCRVLDTRTPPGPNGGPRLAAGMTRVLSMTSSPCGIPAVARAFSLNVTVVPTGFLDYLTLWPAGAPQPFISTINSYDGQVTANAAIVSAGGDASISAFATNDTDLILDVNGYFVDPTINTTLAFYPVSPCRVVDTRNPPGPLGGPILTGGATRSFPIQSGPCLIPVSAQAYVLNATVVPSGFLDYLTLWPATDIQPFVSTLNAYDGQVTANMAIVPAGSPGGPIDAFATQNTHLILDITGYFAPPSVNGLSLYAITPCRAVDTRNPTGPLGGPIMSAATSRSFPLLSSPCGLPAQVAAYSLHATVVPSGFLGYLTVWPSGLPQPFVSTLNAYDGRVTSNSLIVPRGSVGAVSAFVTDTTHLIFDVTGFFAP